MEHEDVLDIAIVGAGIAGINMAHAIATQTTAGTTYAVFESRETLGGTWELFRYPGIRTDSDIFTFGFAWNPWRGSNTLVTADDILSYMHESARMHAIDDHIRYRHRVLSADWSSSANLWNITMEVTSRTSRSIRDIRARFLVLGTGYYDYDTPLQTEIPGLQNFKGTVVHPQFWPHDLNYKDKNMVIIGSGATAITLLPAVAAGSNRVRRVTMLQRSPTYIVPVVHSSPLTKLTNAIFPLAIASTMNRLRFVITTYLFFYFCVIFPNAARKGLRKATIKALPPGLAYAPNFEPRYNPWQQRLCVCPDGDFFTALAGKTMPNNTINKAPHLLDDRKPTQADIVTATISHITSDTIHLNPPSAALSTSTPLTLHPDIIVTATGLKLRFAGGIALSLDSKPIDPNKHYTWRGCMLSTIPNLFFIMGYFNASYTLAAEVTAQTTISVLRSMRQRGKTVVIPTPTSAEIAEFRGEERKREGDRRRGVKPKFEFTSTYLKTAAEVFPKASLGKGIGGVWGVRSNYLIDLWRAKWGDNQKGLEML